MIKQFVLAAAAAAALLAATPAPPPAMHFPDRPLQATFQVEVNHKGQVVRVMHGTFSGNQSFDTMVLGNAMQMWIRRPDGSAVTGLYKVQYDYNNIKHTVSRNPSLISAGGSWANSAGAATLIIDEAKRQTLAAYKRLIEEQKKVQAERAKHLPDINAAVRKAVIKPSPPPQP